ncbi:MAG: hypothetical protein KC656_22220 [Myxococcales bacterium]|nr:hypothetical protein [Myxococcales bacterium]
MTSAIQRYLDKKSEERKKREERQQVAEACVHALSSTHEGRSKLVELAKHVRRKEAHA